nr:MAG TPA: hypothetical protein [Caudoviricetes sp.]
MEIFDSFKKLYVLILYYYCKIFIFCNFIRKYVLFLVNPCRKTVRGV